MRLIITCSACWTNGCFNHLVVKVNHTSLSPGTRVLIYSSRQAQQVHIRLLKSIMPWSASSAASPMVICFTDEEDNAISQQIHLPPWAVSAFFRWQLMLRGQVLLCLNRPIQSKGSVSSLIPQARSMLQLSLVSADGEESRHGIQLDLKLHGWKHLFTLQISSLLSETAALSHGVPQGSVLGPIFLLCMCFPIGSYY